MNLFKTVKNGLIAFTLATLAVAGFAAKTTITYIHTDHLGSPVLATKEDGTVKWREDYQPFGQQLTNEDTDNNIGFTGHKDDKGLGLTYMQARWYHPEVGRFMALDPVKYTDANPVMSFNRYMYGNNHPYKYVDPDGRLPILIPIAIFVAKEVASEVIERQTGVPMPTLKNAGKFAFKKVAGAVGDAIRDGAVGSAKKQVTNNAPKYSRNKYKSVTRTEKKRVLEENPACVYCEKKPSTTVDHIRSQKQDWDEGGWADSRDVRSARVNDPSNLTGACSSCNSSKGSKPLGTGEGQWTPPKDR